MRKQLLVKCFEEKLYGARFCEENWTQNTEILHFCNWNSKTQRQFTIVTGGAIKYTRRDVLSVNKRWNLSKWLNLIRLLYQMNYHTHLFDKCKEFVIVDLHVFKTMSLEMLSDIVWSREYSLRREFT